MGDEKPQQKPVPEKAPDKSVDALKIASDLARQELEFKQETETKTTQKEYQKDKTAIRADLDAQKAELLASTAPAQSQAPMTDAERAQLDAATTLAVEAAPTAPTTSPEKPASTTPPGNPATPAATETAPTPTSEKGFGDKLKDFFAGFFDKIKDFFSKLFGKKEAEKTPEVAKPTEQPVATVDSTAQPAANPEVLNSPDSTAGLNGDALLYNPQFKERSQQIANKIGVSLSDLYAIFKMEGVKNGKVDAQAINPTSGASGLIQWIPVYAPEGTTIDGIRKMTGLQQLEYVDKHFSRWAGKIRTFADLYRTVFFPASIGKGPDYIFGSHDGRAELYAKQNSGIAKYAGRSDGLIDNAGFERYANSRRPKDSILNA